MIAVLDNIRSKYNVGSIIRTSDAVGIQRIYLSGITPPPVNKYKRKDFGIAKVSLGAEDSIEWRVDDNTSSIVNKLKQRKYKIYSIEQSKNAQPYYKIRPSGKELNKIAIIVGNEVGGISKNILNNSDKILEIPMSGKKESLNVSVAFGIIAFSLKYSKI